MRSWRYLYVTAVMFGTQVVVFDLQVHLLYIDFGNREVSTAVKCATLPALYAGPSPYAHEYALACVALPKDVSSQQDLLSKKTANSCGYFCIFVGG